MPNPYLDAIVLLGWLDSEEAVEFLRKDCIFELPLTEGEAKEKWGGYRQRVDALQPREARAPELLHLTNKEKESARRFLAEMYRNGIRNIRDVIKIDPSSLVLHQLVVVLDKAGEYQGRVSSMDGWIRECLPTKLTEHQLQVTFKQSGTNSSMDVSLPHGEFFFAQNPMTGAFQVVQGGRHVTVQSFDHRMLLTAGYHRTYARVSCATPEANERPVLVALVRETLPSSQSALAGNKRLSALRGLRPPLFGDFLDDRLFMRVRLRKKRYALEVRARVVALDVEGGT